jgi:hypothetical protein
MSILLKFTLIFLFLSTNFAFSSVSTPKKDTSYIFSGIVYDVETGNPQRSVTVRVANLDIGKYTDKDGNFKLKLPEGKYTVLFSMVGKKTEIVEIDLNADINNYKVILDINPALTGDVLVIAETAAERLMRKTIEKKIQSEDSIHTYSYSLYTKFVASADTSFAGRKDNETDTTILSIFESYSKGYHKKPDLYYNEIIQRRQSVNIPPQANFVTFGTNINAFEDYVRLIGDDVATPFHKNALDFYDFTLDEKYESKEISSARIIATPKNNNRKQFTGFVILDTVNLIPKYVELTPNIAVKLPFDAVLFYKQSFDFINNYFVTPAYLNIYSSVDAGFLWVISPRIDIKIETFAYDYEINNEIPSKYFNRRRVEASKKADEFDTLFWKMNQVVPLTKDEIYAYDAIARSRENPDSALTEGFFGTYFAPINRLLQKLANPPFTGWTDIFAYNRVHGAYLGIGVRSDFTDYNEGYAKIGYGFADKRPYGSLQIKQFFEEERMFALTAESFYNLKRMDNPYSFRSEGITITSLLFNNDYGDYYYAQGYKIGFEAGLGQLRFIRRNVFERPNTIKFYIQNERQRQVETNTEFSIFSPSLNFRPNPFIIEGNETAIGFELNYNISPERRLSDFGVRIEGMISDPSILNSDFSYKRISGSLNLRTKTLPLWRIDMRLSGGISQGHLPPQRFFSLESSVAGISGLTSFRGLRVKEFYGDRFAMLSFEHNFGEVIPGVLRIPNVASFGLEFAVFGNIGYTEFTENALFSPIDSELMRNKTTASTPDKFVYEIGFGINQILIFLRLDVAARFSQVDVPKFFVTIGGASF